MRKTIVIAVLTVASVLASLLVATAPADAAGTPTSTNGPCGYTSTPDDPPARPVSLPPDPAHTPDQGIVRVVVATSQGPMILSLDRAKAPCTVQSFLHLAKSRFYDFTTCHRLTLYPTLKVLQCGDPSGTGTQGPGYSFDDELTGNESYPAGTVAMANAGPDTNGSQFFLVFADSRLRPNYTVFGSVDRLGLATLDRVAAGGIAPTPDDPDGIDGAPVRKTDILIARSA